MVLPLDPGCVTILSWPGDVPLNPAVWQDLRTQLIARMGWGGSVLVVLKVWRTIAFPQSLHEEVQAWSALSQQFPMRCVGVAQP